MENVTIRLSCCALVSAVGFISGCGAESDSDLHLRRVQQPQLGGIDFGDLATCTESDVSVITMAAHLGRVVAQSGGFHDCVERALNGDLEGGGAASYVPFSFDPSPDHVLNLLESPNAIEITGCDHNLTAGDDVHHPGFIGDERMDVNPSTNDNFAYPVTSRLRLQTRVPQLARTAGVLWHESMHTYGYRHNEPPTGFDTLHTVPYIMDWCMQRVAAQSVDYCDMRSCKTGALEVTDSFDWPEGSSSPDCSCVRDVSGGANQDYPPPPRLGQNEAYDHYSQAMARGDFNGDGYDDLAVGAPGENGVGAVFIYRGSVFGLLPHEVLDPTDFGPGGVGASLFGQALAAGDFHGDGFDDLLVGAPGSGEVFVYEGLPGSPVSPAQRLGADRVIDPGLPPGSEFGYSLALDAYWPGTGDCSSPGPQCSLTLVVGAPGQDAGRGKIYVYDASAWGFDLESDFTPPGAGSPARFGASLAVGQHFRATPTLAVGAPTDAFHGRVYLFEDGSETPYSVLAPPPFAGFAALWPAGYGTSVAVGIMSTVRSIAVGAPLANFYAGSVYVYNAGLLQGGPQLLETLSSTGTSLFGTSLELLPIVADSPYTMPSQLMVGVPLDGTGGHIRVYHYDEGVLENGPFHGYQVLSQHGLLENVDWYGFSVSTGDFDGDNRMDFAGGAPHEAIGLEAESGAIFVWRSGDALPSGGADPSPQQGPHAFVRWQGIDQND